MREFVEWLLRTLGLIRVSEVARQEAFETTLAMLYPNEEDRENLRQAALMIAKIGASYDDVARSCQIIALGYVPEERAAETS